MTDIEPEVHIAESPAMGERRARWGLSYQDKVATERILAILKSELRSGKARFKGVRLADLEAGRVDDFVLVWGEEVEGHSIKWSEAGQINWAELIGANGLIKELAEGYDLLRKRWPKHLVSVKLQTNQPPAAGTHHAQLVTAFSVDTFLREHWATGPSDSDPAELAQTWRQIQTHSGLSDNDFREFVAICSFALSHPEPSMEGPDSRDWQHYVKQFDSLHKAIATWISNQPTRDFIDLEFLLSAIDFRGYRSGLIQKFPLPSIPYVRNAAAAAELRALIESSTGGFVAVTGPAGVGKSTIVQDVLGADYPFFVPYYAFLPDDSGTTRDRSEALVFYQDVVSRLDRIFSKRHSLGISDLLEGREAIRHLFASAQEQFQSQGHKTVLLIDGLDHAQREVTLDRSIIDELPEPDEIPEGVIIVLGSQPQALEANVVRPSISHELREGHGRRIKLEGLTRDEVHRIGTSLPTPPTDSEIDELCDASAGSPLILTYLLKLALAEGGTVERAISELGHFAGDIDRYYAARLDATLTSAQDRRVLGLLARAAPWIPIGWLQSWPESARLEELYQSTLVPFTREEQGCLFFIHNSVVGFLRERTRSRLPGANLEEDEQSFHSELADRCGMTPCNSVLGRARVMHLQKAGRFEDLLTQLSANWLRNGLEEFVPYHLIRPLILAGLEAAWRLGRLADVLRLTLLDFEINQRTSRTEGAELADILLQLEESELAILQIRSGGRIQVDDADALTFCGKLWTFGSDQGSEYLTETAKQLYQQCKPIALMYRGEEIDTFRSSDHYTVLRSWCNVALLFEPIDSVVAQIDGLRFKQPEHTIDPDEASVKSGLYYGALRTLISHGGTFQEFESVLYRIKDLGEPTWIFASLLNAAELSEGHISEDELKAALKLCQDDDFSLAYATHAYRLGDKAGAAEIIEGIKFPRVDALQGGRSLGFTDVSFISCLSRYKHRLGLSLGELPGVNSDDDEALARIEWAARTIGGLETLSAHDLRSAIRSILLFENHRIEFDQYDFRKGYLVRQSRNEIVRELARASESLGSEALQSLKDACLELTANSSSGPLTPRDRRKIAEILRKNSVLDQESAVQFGLSSTSDVEDEDPMARQGACFEIALFLHRMGERQKARDWLAKAAKVSAGTGSHKDYHMSYLADWLNRSITGVSAIENQVCEKFARSIDIAGGAGQVDAAKDLLAIRMRVDPGSAHLLAVELVDRHVLNIADVIEGLIRAGSKSGSDGAVLAAIYKHIGSLIAPGSTASSVKHVLDACAKAELSAKADELMHYIRIHVLPSHRIEAAKAVQDALLESGSTTVIDCSDLPPSHNESAVNPGIYRVAAGQSKTRLEVAALLSDPSSSDHWNPNPDENKHFDWSSALHHVRIQNAEHIRSLEEAIGVPEYHEVEFYAWRSKAHRSIGQIQAARDEAERAVAAARDASWFRWYDGAQKITAFQALIDLDHDAGMDRARQQFGLDLIHGKLNSSDLIANIPRIFEFLELDWPVEHALEILGSYLDQVLAASSVSEPYTSFGDESDSISSEEALCRFVIRLLAFPVIEICLGARAAMAETAIHGGSRTVWEAGTAVADSVQFEHVLIALHMAALSKPGALKDIEQEIQSCNRNPSAAVRGVARRICIDLGWAWDEVTDELPIQQILLPAAVARDVSYEEAQNLMDNGASVAANLFRRTFRGVSGDREEIDSQFLRIFAEVFEHYEWRTEKRLKRWLKLSLSQYSLHRRAIVGREAAMRLLGTRALSGQAKPGVEDAYDFLYPIYDPALELTTPAERPVELMALNWDRIGGSQKEWFAGDGADDWAKYPADAFGATIIGERTYLIRPEWDWPREERYRGITVEQIGEGESSDMITADQRLVFHEYLRGEGQDDLALTMMNSEEMLLGSQYRWIAFNSNIARSLGWVPDDSMPFSWQDQAGTQMVWSVYWKDAWIRFTPPRFEPIGEGWLVLASERALETIKEEFPLAEIHLWVDRHASGENAFDRSWHLHRPL